MSGFMPVGDAVSVTLQRALEGASLRQRLIADNVANAATPGFRAKSVNFEGALAAAVSNGTPEAATFAPVDAGTPAKMDGNTVDLARELTLLTENQLHYDTLVAATNNQINIVRSALSR